MTRVPRVPLRDDTMDRLGDWLAGLAARQAFNGSVLIAERGSVRFQQHYGYADILKAAPPLTDRSSFSLASVSKQFTGLAILLLERQGRLHLNDMLARHIPELSFYPGITLRQLLHHTSGLPDYMELADAYWPDRLLTHPDLIALLATHRPYPYFDPGDQFEYSNTGYALLGDIVARVSGMSYPDFMAAEIFTPLGMRDSAAFNLSSAACPLAERVYGFARDAGGALVMRDLNNLDGLFGDGGIYASAADLLRWDIALRDGALLPAAQCAPAYESGCLNDGRLTGYGFGWEIVAPDVVDHWGEWQGFDAYLRRDLARQTLLVMLSNLGPRAGVEPIARELSDAVERMS